VTTPSTSSVVEVVLSGALVAAEDPSLEYNHAPAEFLLLAGLSLCLNNNKIIHVH